MTLIASMRSALEAGQFSVVYQPIVGLPGGELRGVEALLRWNHPTLGVLSPETFITLAEESGVITPIGRWVIDTACRQAAQWQLIRPGTAPFISVNLSPLQAQDPGFVGDVARTLADTESPPELLQLELTESALVEADSLLLETLQKLSAMGVRIAATTSARAIPTSPTRAACPSTRSEAVGVLHPGSVAGRADANRSSRPWPGRPTP